MNKILIDISAKEIWDDEEINLVKEILLFCYDFLSIKKSTELSVRLTDDKEIMELNKKYRNDNSPTKSIQGVKTPVSKPISAKNAKAKAKKEGTISTSTANGTASLPQTMSTPTSMAPKTSSWASVAAAVKDKPAPKPVAKPKVKEPENVVAYKKELLEMLDYCEISQRKQDI